MTKTMILPSQLGRSWVAALFQEFGSREFSIGKGQDCTFVQENVESVAKSAVRQKSVRIVPGFRTQRFKFKVATYHTRKSGRGDKLQDEGVPGMIVTP